MTSFSPRRTARTVLRTLKATYFIPSNPNGQNSLLSYQYPYNSCNANDCASYILKDSKHAQHKPMITNILFGLSKGWYVIIADQEGPDSALGDGILAGHVVLDSIRATLNLGLGLRREDARIAIWGFSGGAIAGAWAAQLQAHYAPDLFIEGACLGGLPTILSTLFDTVNGTRWAAQIPQILSGITMHSPEIYNYIISELKEEHRAEFKAVRTANVMDTFEKFSGRDFFGQFTRGNDFFHHPALQRLLARSTFGNHGVPSIQLFLYKAVGDDITPIEHLDEVVDRWSTLGVNILYERNTVGDHLEESANSRERAIEVVASMLNGAYSQHGCEIRNVRRSVVVDNPHPILQHIASKD